MSAAGYSVVAGPRFSFLIDYYRILIGVYQTSGERAALARSKDNR